jgi:cation:H+ antiporter
LDIGLVLINIGILVVSLIIIIKSADVFIDNIVKIGRAIGISQIILGVTAAAIGTSLPEFGSSLLATVSHSSNMGVGIILGSNIWNVAGIFGITATITGLIKADSKSLTRDGLVTIVTGIILVAVMAVAVIFFNPLSTTPKDVIGVIYTNNISIIGSIIMVLFIIYYFRVLVKSEGEQSNNGSNSNTANGGDSNTTNSGDSNTVNGIESNDDIIVGIQEFEGDFSEIPDTNSQNQNSIEDNGKISIKDVVYAAVSIILLGVCCNFLIDSATVLADVFGIPTTIMALFTLSIGTSIPELVVTLSSAMKGLHDISLGTIYGSVTFNMLIAIGIFSFFAPINVEPLSLFFDAPVMILIIIISMLLFKFNKLKLNRTSGLILLGIYIAYAFIRIFVLV